MYGSLPSVYGGGLVPQSGATQTSQTGTYTSTDRSLALHFDESMMGFPFMLALEDVTAPYSSEAIALDPTRYYGDTIARRRVYIRYRGTVADAGTN